MFTWVEPRTWLMRYARVMEIRWIKPHNLKAILIKATQVVQVIALLWGWSKQGRISHSWVEWHHKVYFKQIHLQKWIWRRMTINLIYRPLNQPAKKACRLEETMEAQQLSLQIRWTKKATSAVWTVLLDIIKLPVEEFNWLTRWTTISSQTIESFLGRVRTHSSIIVKSHQAQAHISRC